ncbi:hypothetical protein MMC13_002468 [Lambiella insularis]|nr:hypothetical protein [Lambiella insularis]
MTPAHPPFLAGGMLRVAKYQANFQIASLLTGQAIRNQLGALTLTTAQPAQDLPNADTRRASTVVSARDLVGGKQQISDNVSVTNPSHARDYHRTGREHNNNSSLDPFHHRQSSPAQGALSSSARTASSPRAKDVLVIGFDFGTTFSAVSYGVASVLPATRVDGQLGQSRIGWHDINDVHFCGEANENVEISTVLAYKYNSTSGFKLGPDELEEANIKPEEFLALTKMLLDEDALQSNATLKQASMLIRRLDKRTGSRQGQLRPTTVVDVWSDVIKWLCRKAFFEMIHGRKYILDTTPDGYQYINLPVHYALCVPASWPLNTTNQALTALKMAADRIFFMSPDGRIYLLKREANRPMVRFFSLVREPIAATASIFAYQGLRHNTGSRLDRVEPEEAALVLDIGGGTTDAAFVTRKSEADGIMLDEMISGDGCCGVMLWTSLLRDLVVEKFADRWKDILGTPNPGKEEIDLFLSAVEKGFEKEKKGFKSVGSPKVSIQIAKHLRAYLRPNSSLGVSTQKIDISREELQKRVFNPVIDTMIQLVKTQLAKFEDRYGHLKTIKYILLVGSPSRNEYLVDRFRREFEDSPFLLRTGQVRDPLEVKNNMVIATATMNSRGAVEVVGNQMIGTQYLQYNLAVGQDIPWCQDVYPSLQVCEYQSIRLKRKGHDGRWKDGVFGGEWEEAEQDEWEDKNDARCGYEKMDEFRDTAHWVMTKTMPLRPEETYRIPLYRLIPSEKIGHTWKETIWLSHTERAVEGCLLFDPENNIQTFYEIAFDFKDWKKLDLQGLYEGRTKLYQVEYVLEIQKTGPAMSWKVSIPKHGIFMERNDRLWETEIEECTKVQGREPVVYKGEIVSTRSYGQAFPLGSDTVMTNAPRDLA